MVESYVKGQPINSFCTKYVRHYQLMAPSAFAHQSQILTTQTFLKLMMNTITKYRRNKRHFRCKCKRWHSVILIIMHTMCSVRLCTAHRFSCIWLKAYRVKLIIPLKCSHCTKCYITACSIHLQANLNDEANSVRESNDLTWTQTVLLVFSFSFHCISLHCFTMRCTLVLFRCISVKWHLAQSSLSECMECSKYVAPSEPVQWKINSSSYNSIEYNNVMKYRSEKK